MEKTKSQVISRKLPKERKDAIKKQIAKILNIDVSNGWDILDYYPEDNLYLVHYTEQPFDPRFKNIRGIIVDIERKITVCSSLPYTPIATVDKLVVTSNGNMNIIDDVGNNYQMKMKNIRIQYGFEGLTVRVFMYNGKVFISTYKKINIKGSSSRWGGILKTTYIEMYKNMNGPKDEELFDLTTNYSPFVHIFIMVNPNLFLVSRQKTYGYIVYLATKRMWSSRNINLPKEEIDRTLWSPKNLVTQISEIIFKENYLYPVDLKLADANVVLESGYYDYTTLPNPMLQDPRLGSGEFVMLYHNQNEKLVDLIRIQSTAYSWRSSIREIEPNLLYRFYELLDSTQFNKNNSDALNEFIQKFPILKRYDHKSVENILFQNKKYILFWEVIKKNYTKYLSNRPNRIYVMWASLLMAVPIRQQKGVFLMFNEYFNNKFTLHKWLIDTSKISNLMDVEGIYNKQVKFIIGQADFLTIRDLNNKKINVRGYKPSYETLFSNHLNSQLNQTRASNIYAMISNMNNIIRGKKESQFRKIFEELYGEIYDKNQ